MQQYTLPTVSRQSNFSHSLYRSPFIIFPLIFLSIAFFQRASHIEFTRRFVSLRIPRRCVLMYTSPKRSSYTEKSVIGLPPDSQCKFAYAPAVTRRRSTRLHVYIRKNAATRFRVSVSSRRIAGKMSPMDTIRVFVTITFKLLFRVMNFENIKLKIISFFLIINLFITIKKFETLIYFYLHFKNWFDFCIYKIYLDYGYI